MPRPLPPSQIHLMVWKQSRSEAADHGEEVAVEIGTGRSDTKKNLTKIAHADFDRIVLVAISPAGSEACRKAMASVTGGPPVQLLTWLDLS